MTTLNKDQLTDLVNEFVSFKINDMSQEDIYQYLRDIMRQEIICQRNHLTLQESLKEQIDEYDENLYEILEDYVTCLLYTSPSPRDDVISRMPSSA